MDVIRITRGRRKGGLRIIAATLGDQRYLDRLVRNPLFVTVGETRRRQRLMLHPKQYPRRTTDEEAW